MVPEELWSPAPTATLIPTELDPYWVICAEILLSAEVQTPPFSQFGLPEEKL